MNITPLADRVVVKALEVEEKLASGIIVPDTAKEKPQQGVIVAVGAGRLLDNGTRAALEVAVNDRIIYSKYSGTEIKLEGSEYLILNERDILAKL